MWLTEYNEEEVMQQFRDEGYEEGRNGIIRGMLASGKLPQEISDFCKIPIELVQEVQNSMLSAAK